ncbi:MAG: hypothetical protein GX589_02255 [Deltaproteobacteria bacterium]|nr:hypothetical protein [Deltaproteobacteria bacterium]
MNANANLLKNLVVISKIDAFIAGINSEKKKLVDQLAAKRQNLAALELSAKEKAYALRERKLYYEREDLHLKESQQKLVERRKALTTLGSYKLQVAAEREIEAAARQLAAQEERYVNTLDELDALEAAAVETKSAFETATEDLKNFQEEAKETSKVLEERLKGYMTERDAMVPLIDQKSLALYNRVKDKYPMDAVVVFSQNACSGCFLELGPQVTLEIARGNALVRCRGCGRILFLEDSKEE